MQIETRTSKLIDIVIAPDELLGKTGTSPYENPDKNIAQKGVAYIEAEVERDSQVTSVLKTRIGNLIKRGYSLNPPVINGKTPAQAFEAAEFMQYCFNNMSSDFITDISTLVHSGLSRGFSLTEKNTKIISQGRFKGKLGLESLRHKKQQWFAFDFDEKARYSLNQVDPILKKLPLDKFIHYIHGQDDENPYGESLSSKAAFYVWLKKNGWKFWCKFIDLYAAPIPKVDIPNGISKNDEAVFIKKAELLIKSIQNGSGIVVPKGLVVDFLQANYSGVNSYEQFVDRCNREISKLFLGQTLTSESDKGKGTHALGSVHADVLNTYTMFDLIVTSAIINKQLVQWLHNFNYPPELCPTFNWNNTISIADAQALETLQRIGLPISLDYAYKMLGVQKPKPYEQTLSLITAASIKQTSPGIDNKAKSTVKHNATNAVFFQAEHKKQIRKNENIIFKATKLMASHWDIIKNEITKHKKIKTSAKDFGKKLQPTILNFMVIAKIYGINSVKAEINKKHSDLERVNYFADNPLQHLINALIKRKAITKKEFENLKKQLKKDSFTVAGQEAETIEKIKLELIPTLTGDKATIKDFQTKINTYFTNLGITPLKPWHLELVVRNNLQIQYNKARKEVFDKLDEADFPQLQVTCILDNKTRKSHAALNGYTASKNNPIWQTLIPPFDHNCRCQIRAVHASEQLKNSSYVPNTKDLGFIGG